MIWLDQSESRAESPEPESVSVISSGLVTQTLQYNKHYKYLANIPSVTRETARLSISQYLLANNDLQFVFISCWSYQWPGRWQMVQLKSPFLALHHDYFDDTLSTPRTWYTEQELKCNSILPIAAPNQLTRIHYGLSLNKRNRDGLFLGILRSFILASSLARPRSRVSGRENFINFLWTAFWGKVSHQ